MGQKNTNSIAISRVISLNQSKVLKESLMESLRNLKESTARKLNLLWASFALFQMKSWQNLGTKNPNKNMVTCISEWQDKKKNGKVAQTKATDSARGHALLRCCSQCGTMFSCYIKGCVILFRKQKPEFPTNQTVDCQQPERLGFRASEVTGCFPTKVNKHFIHFNSVFESQTTCNETRSVCVERWLNGSVRRQRLFVI